MSLSVLIMVALPLGVYILIYEQKSDFRYPQIMHDFFIKVKNNKNLQSGEKIEKLKIMLIKNHFTIVEKTKNKISGDKKNLSLGWMTIGIGFAYIGLLIYVIYYIYFLKPYRVTYEI